MSEWPDEVERVSAVLRAAGVDSRIEEFESGTPTAREAARAVGCELAQIVKSLVVVCDGAFVVAFVPGDRRADERLIAKAVGAEFVRIAKPEEVVHATGFEPGAVAPFPHRAVSQTLMDPILLRHETVWVGAGTHRHMASLAPAELQRLTRARAVEVTPSG